MRQSEPPASTTRPRSSSATARCSSATAADRRGDNGASSDPPATVGKSAPRCLSRRIVVAGRRWGNEVYEADIPAHTTHVPCRCDRPFGRSFAFEGLRELAEDGVATRLPLLSGFSTLVVCRARGSSWGTCRRSAAGARSTGRGPSPE